MMRFSESVDAGMEITRAADVYAESLAEEVGQIIGGRPDESTMLRLLAAVPGMSEPTDALFGFNRELDYVWLRCFDSGRRVMATWSMRDYLSARRDDKLVPAPRSHEVKEMASSG